MQIPAELEISRGLPPSGCSVSEAERYTRWLATHHYENFNVVSWLLPRRLHQHFYNLYAYCRWADDWGTKLPIRRKPSRCSMAGNRSCAIAMREDLRIPFSLAC